MSPIDNSLALAEIMAWCRIADKPLSEPILTLFSWTKCVNIAVIPNNKTERYLNVNAFLNTLKPTGPPSAMSFNVCKVIQFKAFKAMAWWESSSFLQASILMLVNLRTHSHVSTHRYWRIHYISQWILTPERDYHPFNREGPLGIR